MSKLGTLIHQSRLFMTSFASLSISCVSSFPQAFLKIIAVVAATITNHYALGINQDAGDNLFNNASRLLHIQCMTDVRRDSLFVVQQYSIAEDCLGLGRLGSCFSQRCKVTTKYCNEFVAAEGGRFSSHLHYLDLTMDD